MLGQEIAGFRIYAGLLDLAGQRAMLAAVERVVAEAPLYQPVTPGGQQMSVRMTAAGRLGWITDRQGYRYAEVIRTVRCGLRFPMKCWKFGGK